ncbi:MAG: HlyD family efflux transporter periplasmic adaptor subunit [Planctomycetia bacterium]|nr:HlyD family efflux transporter periplasmic adaptor subunit [Planctomycetia bacterium]
MNHRAIVAFAGLLVGAATVFALAYYGKLPGIKTSTTVASTTDNYVDDAGNSSAKVPLTRVVALARLEPADGTLELGGVPGDRIEKVAVKPGQSVRRDEELVVLESRKLRQLELEAAQSQLAEAVERLRTEQNYGDTLVREAEAGLEEVKLDDLEVAAQETRIKSLQLQAEAAERSLARTSKLSEAVSSPQQLDQVRLARDQAAAEFAAAQDQIKKLKAGRDLKHRIAKLKQEEAIAGRGKIDAAVPLESLRKGVAAATERLKQSTLRAPTDGYVLEVLGDEGDAVGPTPIVRMGNVARMVAVAEVYETQAHSVVKGQPSELTADALPAKLVGNVDRVGTVVGKNRLLSVDPTHGADSHVVEVRIALDEASSRAAAVFVGMQVTATIDVRKSP